ncbi:MAG: hypothetical protein ACXVHT_12520 [Methanobacterium sp.]
MIEVKGKNKHSPGILTFDGDVLEIFGFGHKHASRRFHIDQISFLMKESNGLSIGYEVGLISISCTEGCENIDELIEAIVSASTNPDLVVK